MSFIVAHLFSIVKHLLSMVKGDRTKSEGKRRYLSGCLVESHPAALARATATGPRAVNVIKERNRFPSGTQDKVLAGIKTDNQIQKEITHEEPFQLYARTIHDCRGSGAGAYVG
jgi:hypothetical protein